jgi:hypothetical protein
VVADGTTWAVISMVAVSWAEGTGVGDRGMGVLVGLGLAAGRGSWLVNLGAVLTFIESGRSESACPICRQIRSDSARPIRRQIPSASSSPTVHVTSSRDLVRPSIETNNATMHATEDAIVN